MSLIIDEYGNYQNHISLPYSMGWKNINNPLDSWVIREGESPPIQFFIIVTFSYILLLGNLLIY